MLDRKHLTERAAEIVENSSLSVEDKKLLHDRIPYCETSILTMFVEVCDQDPFSIDFIVRNLKKKLDAGGNLTKIHAIVREEREEFERRLAESKL
jgi:hypothetical protein